MRIFVLAAVLVSLAGVPALAQSHVPELELRSYWREDIALESIPSPPDTFYEGETYYPTVKGMNYGVGSRYVFVGCILDDGTDAIIYSSLQGVAAPPREPFTLTFAVSFRFTPGTYYVEFFTDAGDSWPENDTIGKYFVVLPREGGLDGSRPRNRVRGRWCNDIEVVGFFGIPDTIRAGETVHPSVLLLNHGWGSRSAWLHFALDDGTDRVVYSTMQGVTVPAGDTARVNFAIPFTFEPGTYTFMAWVTHQDSWPENDSVWKVLVVIPREGGLDDGEVLVPQQRPENRFWLEWATPPPDSAPQGYRFPRDVYVRGRPGATIPLWTALCTIEDEDTCWYWVDTTWVVNIMNPLRFGDYVVGQDSMCWVVGVGGPDGWLPDNTLFLRILPTGGGDEVAGDAGRGPGEEFRVRPSIVRAGEMISVVGLGPRSRAQVIDAAGRVVGLIGPGSTAIAAPCLPGVYYIRRQEDDRTSRVLVQ